MNPCPEKPAAIQSPACNGPIKGWKSGVFSYSPAQAVLTRASSAEASDAGDCRDAVEERPVHAGVVARRGCRVAHAEEHALAFRVENRRRCESRSSSAAPPNAGEGLGYEDLPPRGTIGTWSPSIAPTGADHGPAQMTVCEASVSPPPCARPSPFLQPSRTPRPRCLPKSRRPAVAPRSRTRRSPRSVPQAVAWTEGRAAEIVGLESRDQCARLRGFELDDVVQAPDALQLEHVVEAQTLVLGC